MDLNSSNRDSSGDVPSPSKRLLVKNAWVAPVILAVTLPRASYAANVSGTTKHHSDDGNHFGQNKNHDNGNHFGQNKNDDNGNHFGQNKDK